MTIEPTLIKTYSFVNPSREREIYFAIPAVETNEDRIALPFSILLCDYRCNEMNDFKLTGVLTHYVVWAEQSTYFKADFLINYIIWSMIMVFENWNQLD